MLPPSSRETTVASAASHSRSLSSAWVSSRVGTPLATDEVSTLVLVVPVVVAPVLIVVVSAPEQAPRDTSSRVEAAAARRRRRDAVDVRFIGCSRSRWCW